MKFVTRIAALFGAAAFLMTGLAIAPASAAPKKVVVHAHTRVSKSGKVAHVKAYTRTVGAKKTVKVHSSTRTLKSGKVVKVKAYNRAAPGKKPKM